ncbi:hypothetical protein [Clostridium haemolyticum]|uniref:Uncharacterized protein n=1 Tax=Clostridium haemolyticum NCTC 9693 TaxID=1443114 RepID=A0ABR4THW9_CLOHA|nr:hypothetical protein [Clostridium haemolyticum]KEI18216.1 hypothetical protein Z960_03540 [Clostridium haemolyticum NCTC 9693]KGN02918.1 hypothetical protein Z961_07800 [Clostridium haemolyticum NCTC 8350]
MGLFSGRKDDKQQKNLEKLNKKMKQYGLENLELKDKESVRDILTGLSGIGLMDFGISITGKDEDIAKISCLRAITEQNFLIIKLLSDINNKLDNK